MAKPRIPGGYILLARKMLESELMAKPPLWAKLWVWMLLTANRQEGYHGLKRGQFFSSIEAMREAMSHHVGYRKVTPSIKEIRKAYEGLAKGMMIGTAKGTHGMIITVLNYDLYQDPENYEGHDEGHNENPTKGTEGAQYKQELYKKNKKEEFSSASDELRLATLLFELIRQRNPEHKAPNLQSWARHIDLMIRMDGRPPERIEQVLRWSQADAFWSRNILSTDKLRKHFDTLAMQMQVKAKPAPVRNPLAAV